MAVVTGHMVYFSAYAHSEIFQLNLFSSKLKVLKWRHHQSPGFGLAVLHPTEFLVRQNMGKDIVIEFFLLYLSVHYGDFIEQIKRICHIHFKVDETGRYVLQVAGWNLIITGKLLAP